MAQVINKSRTKGSRGEGRKPKRKQPSHLTWEFKFRLENEAAVLHSILNVYSIDYYADIVEDIRNLITQLIRNHGFTDGAKRYHIIRNYTISLIEKRNPENPAWLATSEVHRVPSALGVKFIQVIVDCLKCKEEALLPKYYQAINTILNIVRIVEGLTTPDFIPVEEKAKPIDQNLLNSFSAYVEKEIRPYRLPEDGINLFKERFSLQKNGPNGKPKIESSLDEAVALMSGPLRKPFLRICEELKVEYLFEYLQSLVDNQSTTNLNTPQPDSKGENKTLLRKLVKVPDSGFKTRLVAIVDFWTQLVLLPVRKAVQDVIQRKYGKTDFRLDQNRGVAAMKEFQAYCLAGQDPNGIALDAKHLKFYDISSWTDRFHRDLQKIVMRRLFTPRLAEAWAQLVVHCDWYSPDLKRNVRYGQGQGMGTNGSFDIATLTDHLFINYLMDEVQSTGRIFPQNACYGKVGDDLWIYDPEDLIPKYYEKINLPINFSKSKEYGELGSLGEFCSRTFLNTVDVSRISPRIINRSKDFRYMPTLLAVCSQRGVQLDAMSFPRLNRKVKNGEESYIEKLQYWIVSYMALAVQEHGSQLVGLNMDYLVAGNWVTDGPLKRFITDPLLIYRLVISYSIVEITKYLGELNGLESEVMRTGEKLGSNFFAIAKRDTNLFNPSSSVYNSLIESMDCKVILPRDIIIFGRMVDTTLQLSEYLHQLYDEFPKMLQPLSEPILLLKFAKELGQIASRCCYDEGNINYNQKRVYNTQFKFVKVLSRVNEDLTILRLDNQRDVGTLKFLLKYDKLRAKFPGVLPELSSEPEPLADTSLPRR